MAADGEKTQAEEKEEWVTKQPGVTIMEWKQKPGVWQKNIRPMKIHPLLRAKTSTRRLKPNSDLQGETKQNKLAATK